MEKFKKIALAGQAHWSARGELETPAWYWWVEIEGLVISDEEMLTHALTGEKGIEFIKELQPLLPQAFKAPLAEVVIPNGYVRMPDGVPGGNWDIKLSLSECSEPQKAESIVEKYFPKLFEFA